MKNFYLVIPFLLFFNQINSQFTKIPDPCFEQSLVWNHIDSDGIVNGQVATSDVEEVTELRLGYNCIKDLTGLQDFTSLKVLRFYGDVFNHELTSFDTALTPSLEVLTFFYYPKLLDLKVDQARDLVHLSVSGSKISQIDLSKNEKLTYLNLNGNQMNEINLDQNILLEELYISQDLTQNSIEQIDVSNNMQLRVLALHSLPIKEIDVSQNIELTQLSIGHCKIFNLDVSQNTLLDILDIRHNQIESIDVSNNPELVQLECFNNQLTSLDVTFNTQLTNLQCQNNKISALNIETNSKLHIFQCYNNELTELFAKNGNNNHLEWFDSSDNLDLTCIEVDNSTLANSGNGVYDLWITDPEVNYAMDCQYILGLDDENLTHEIKIYPNPLTNKLTIESESIDIYKIKLYNLQGQLLIESRLGTINTDYLSRGIYILSIFWDQGAYVRKVVKI